MLSFFGMLILLLHSRLHVCIFSSEDEFHTCAEEDILTCMLDEWTIICNRHMMGVT
jgi:hypothetical protein